MAKEPSNPEHAGQDASEAVRSNKRMVRTGVAVGIGSAAIVAALLYANRGRKGDRGRD
jgi:hypothetical protein